MQQSGEQSGFQLRPSSEYLNHGAELRLDSELAQQPGFPVEGNMATAASIYWDGIGGCWKLIGSSDTKNKSNLGSLC